MIHELRNYMSHEDLRKQLVGSLHFDDVVAERTGPDHVPQERTQIFTILLRVSARENELRRRLAHPDEGRDRSGGVQFRDGDSQLHASDAACFDRLADTVSSGGEAKGHTAIVFAILPAADAIRAIGRRGEVVHDGGRLTIAERQVGHVSDHEIAPGYFLSSMLSKAAQFSSCVEAVGSLMVGRAWMGSPLSRERDFVTHCL